VAAHKAPNLESERIKHSAPAYVTARCGEPTRISSEYPSGLTVQDLQVPMASLWPFHSELHRPTELQQTGPVGLRQRESSAFWRVVQESRAAWPKHRHANPHHRSRDCKRSRPVQRSPLAPAIDEPKATVVDAPSRLSDPPKQPYVQRLRAHLGRWQKRPQSGL